MYFVKIFNIFMDYRAAEIFTKNQQVGSSYKLKKLFVVNLYIKVSKWCFFFANFYVQVGKVYFYFLFT